MNREAALYEEAAAAVPAQEEGQRNPMTNSDFQDAPSTRQCLMSATAGHP
jgi:hypothetical protein